MDEHLTWKLKTFFKTKREWREGDQSPRATRTTSPPRITDEIRDAKSKKVRERKRALTESFYRPEVSVVDQSRRLADQTRAATYLDPPHPLFQKVRLATGRQDIPRGLKCMCCHTIMQESIKLECHHTFCPSCVLKSEDGTCPYCGSCFLTGEIRPDLRAWPHLLKVRIKCPNNGQGCDWEDEYGNLETHLKACMYDTTPCRNSHRGCTFTHHDAQARSEHFIGCEYSDHVCLYCGEVMYRKNYEDHLTKCGYKPTECRWCSASMPARELEHHKIFDCEDVPMRCPVPGCDAKYTGNRKQIIEHVRGSFGHHLRLFAVHYRENFGSIVHREVVYRVNFFLARCGMNFTDSGGAATTLDGFDVNYAQHHQHQQTYGSHDTLAQSASTRHNLHHPNTLPMEGDGVWDNNGERFVDPKVLPTPALVAGILEQYGCNLDESIAAFRKEVMPAVDSVMGLALWVENIDAEEFNRILSVASFVQRGINILETGVDAANEHYAQVRESFSTMGTNLRDDIRKIRNMESTSDTKLQEMIISRLLQQNEIKYHALVKSVAVSTTNMRMVKQLAGPKATVPEGATVNDTLFEDDEIEAMITESVNITAQEVKELLEDEPDRMIILMARGAVLPSEYGRKLLAGNETEDSWTTDEGEAPFKEQPMVSADDIELRFKKCETTVNAAQEYLTSLGNGVDVDALAQTVAEIRTMCNTTDDLLARLDDGFVALHKFEEERNQTMQATKSVMDSSATDATGAVTVPSGDKSSTSDETSSSSSSSSSSSDSAQSSSSAKD